MLVERFLEDSARAHPAKTAIVSGSRRVTYDALERDSNKLAHALRDAGIRRYDRVAIYLDNSIEAAVAIFATLKAGGVFVVIHPSTKSAKLAADAERLPRHCCRRRWTAPPSPGRGVDGPAAPEDEDLDRHLARRTGAST